MSPPFLIQLLSLLDLVKLKKSRKIRMGLRFFGRVYFETFRLQNSVHAPGDWKEGLLAGIKRDKQWPINWCTSPKMIHKITPYVDWISGWNVRTLNLLNNQSKLTKTKVPKVVKPKNKKMLSWNFGDQCNKHPHCPLSLSLSLSLGC